MDRAAMNYLLDSCLWSVVWLFVGYLVGLIHANIRELRKRGDDDHT